MAPKEYSFIIRHSDGTQQIVPVEFRRTAISKSIRITPNLARQVVSVSYPLYSSRTRAILFLEAKRDWVIRQLEAMPKKQKIAEGSTINLFGERVRVVHIPEARRGVWVEDGRLYVSGSREFLNRRAKDHIKALARRRFTAMAAGYARRLGREIVRVSVKDTTSRWGSCTSDGALSFSWRLALAPMPIAEYVVAHEVVHLKEMNHGTRFWRALAEIYPYDVDAAVRWLARNGAKLYLID